MLFRLFCISSVSALILTACATQQENPYYKYSSKYEGAEGTSTASNIPAEQIQAAPVSYETPSVPYTNPAPQTHDAAPQQIVSNGVIYTRVDQSCVSGQGRDCQPTPIMATHSEPTISEAYTAPTDTQFVDIGDEGTPGYQVMQAQSVEYDYSENIVSTDTPTLTDYSESRLASQASGKLHDVKQGDTVYSLARGLCSGIDEIAALNGLNANYAINIGDKLKLPESKC